jgi:hypothetical protein
MKIESEYNGIQHGELCWVWDNNESKGMEAYFLAYIDNDREYPIIVSDKYGNGNHYDYKHAKPLQTEADKFLEKWKGKKITSVNMWDAERYFIPIATNGNRVEGVCPGDKADYIDIFDFECTLWEPPKKVKLDTRRVAGWWSKNKKSDYIKLLTCVHMNGTCVDMNGTTDPLEGYTFSQDPMKPLDQWQTLEQICGGES